MPEYHITTEKQEQLQIELQDRKSVQRPDILKRLEAARALGDLKENAEYHAMRDAQGKNESRIQEIEEILKFAVLVEKSDDGVAGLGSTVVVQKAGSDPQEFMIVGIAEANILEGKIGDDSPIGSALMGKKAGDTAEVQTPGGVSQYKIIDVK